LKFTDLIHTACNVAIYVNKSSVISTTTMAEQ